MMSDRFDMGILLKEISKKRILRQKHPRLPIWIYNYSATTQYKNDWDKITLQCRGLVLDEFGFVLARPFRKFFNAEEISPSELLKNWKKANTILCQEKVDGSLGILFFYKPSNEWIVATRGSFFSKQAIKAREILDVDYNLELFDKNLTYLFEIIYPENRICVNYGPQEKLVWFGVTDPYREYNYETSCELLKSCGVPVYDVVKTENITGLSLNEILAKKELNLPNKEGFVIKFEGLNFRFKIKFEDYVRLHKIMSNFSPNKILEELKTNGSVSEKFLKDVPDEFFNLVNEIESEFKEQYLMLQHSIVYEFNKIKGKNLKNRKEFAEHTLKTKYPNILFKLFDNKNCSKLIWEIIETQSKKVS